MSSLNILLENLMNHYEATSIRSLAEKLGYSVSVMLNWSSGRSSPSIEQINHIAYLLGIETSQLLIEKNIFSINTPIWLDKVEITLKYNLGKLRLEKDIHERFFNNDITGKYEMDYRAFLRYVNGQNKRVNLKALDRLASILSIEPYKLLERERRK